MAWLFDGILVITLLLLAWNVLRSRDLYQSVVLFIAFGFIMALAWVRLNAPDIALAEAAIGSAMTGALLLAALGEFKPDERVASNGPFVPAGLLCALLLGLLGFAVMNQPTIAVGLREVVAERVPESGVSHPVTAVLLSFRGYDTLLEIAVLLMAVLAVLSIKNAQPAFIHRPSRSPVLAAGVRTLVPVLILVAGYLLWVGAHAPGGAFQAGSVLAGAMILSALTNAHWMHRISALRWRLALTLGLAVFLLVAVGTLFAGGSLLEYRYKAAKWSMLAIEAAAMLSIGVTLLILLVGQITAPGEGEDPS